MRFGSVSTLKKDSIISAVDLPTAEIIEPRNDGARFVKYLGRLKTI
ncbi:hypothetical protein IUSA1_08165 [Streptococcus iniae IUSA1]|nr:hypothetical protein IUSA1_08165 [Streptococcus iniae IUSA1]